MGTSFSLRLLCLRVIGISLLFFNFSGLKAQALQLQPVYKSYGEEQGLPSSEVYMSIQDSKGYMWFATQRGVAKFDGYKFTTYTTQQGLCDNAVLGIHEDHLGRIWFFTYSNQLSYYQNGKIYNHPSNAQLRNLKGVSIPCSLGVDSSGFVWLGFKRHTDRGDMLRIDTTGNINRVLMTPQKPQVAAKVRRLNTGDFVWSAGTALKEAQMAVKLGNTSVKIFDHHENSSNRSRDDINFNFSSNSDGSFVYTLTNGLYRFKNNRISREGDVNYKQTLGILLDRDYKIWIGSFSSGLKTYAQGRIDEVLFENSIVSGITADMEGGIWLSTLNDGVLYIPSKSAKGIPVNRLGKTQISEIEGTPGFLLMSFYRGGALGLEYNQKLNITRSEEIRSEVGVNTFILNRTPWHFLVSNYARGPNMLEYQFTHITRNWELPTLRVTKYTEEEVLLHTQDGFYLLNIQTGKSNFFASLPHFRIKCFGVSHKKELFLGTIHGLFKYNGKGYIKINGNGKLNNLRINDMTFKGDTTLLATLGGGLVLLHNDSVMQITTNEGLASDLCNSVYLDNEGLVWVGTNLGLNSIFFDSNLDSKPSLSTYTNSSGLLSSEVKKVLVLDNLVWTISNKGLSVFDKSKNKWPQVNPKVHLSHLSVNDKRIDPNLDQSFDYNENNINITFGGISFHSGNQIMYKYRMKGLKDAWQFTKETSLTYANLAPKEYTFEVYARNNRGDWSLKPASLTFLIRPPYWQKWWFVVLAVLSILLVTKVIFDAKVKSIRNKNLLMRSAFDAEQKALQSQLNPHFIFNSLTSIQELISSKQYINANKHLSLVARLIRNTLKNSRTPLISLDQELDMLRKYIKLEELRFGDNQLVCRIELGEKVDPEEISIPPMMIQPLIENAIWHGIQNKDDKSGFIHIKFEQNKDFLFCTIEDDGVGRKMAQKLRSKYDNEALGIKIIQERIVLFNAHSSFHYDLNIMDLKNEKDNATGTRVVISFPLK